MVAKKKKRVNGESWVEKWPRARFHRALPHPLQRFTEQRAPRVSKTHLSNTKLKITHTHVVAAYFGGEYYKVDGHTRDFMWTEGLLTPAPTTLTVTLYYFSKSHREDFLALYHTYDNPSTSDSANDFFYGLSREMGLHPLSPGMRSYGYATVRGLAELEHHRSGSREVVAASAPQWMSELAYLNGKQRPGNALRPLLIAEVLCARLYGVKASASFWDCFYAKGGARPRVNGVPKSDAVDSLTRYTDKEKAARKKEKRTTPEDQRRVIGMGIASCEGWQKNAHYVSHPRVTRDLFDVVDKMLGNKTVPQKHQKRGQQLHLRKKKTTPKKS